MRSISSCLFLLVIGFWSQIVLAVDWPQEVTVPEGTITVYQPQPESLAGNTLQGRAAMSFSTRSGKEPIFGAFWFVAHIDTDHDKKLVTIRDVEITKVGWPDSKSEDEAKFTDIVNKAFSKQTFQISTNRLSASLATADKEKKSLENLKNDPPKIIFTDTLAVLLPFDGKPKFQEIENTPYQRAINTPFAVVWDRNTAYLSSGTYWYSAKDARGPWSEIKDPPQDLVKLMGKDGEAKKSNGKAPQIVVATEPTELVSTDGKPNWQALVGGKIMYVVNTETPWLREVSEGKMYVQLSGRWFSATTEAGPWKFVRPDQLPESFKDIPPDSAIGGVRVSIAGTAEALDAMMQSDIPQTAAIDRNKASFTASYDGEPKFESIPGTSISYAVNTAAQILLISKTYYAVDNGVWFTSKSAKGPWAVADKIPSDEIDKIPPSSPVYNTTFVEIYDSTPDTVYVGYTPGYMWSFPYYGVPVYGTGYYYPPYYGTVYTPRPATWGFHVGYNPYSGWNFGVSWSLGFFSFGITFGGGYGAPYGPRYCCGGFYGGGYRPAPVIVNTGKINIGNTVNVGNRSTKRNISGNNLYDRPQNRNRNSDIRSDRRAKPNPKKANDVFVDKDGNLARNRNGEWQGRENGTWQNSDPGRRETRDRQGGYDRGGASDRFDRQSLDFDRDARQRGRSSERGSRGGGGRGGRGGGGRR